MSCRMINLEAGFPNVESALGRLSGELSSARARGTTVVKVIHGYGSSGAGGSIKSAVHRMLEQKRRSGVIRAYVKGEDFSPFSASARAILAAEPSLSRDSDYSRGNDGITIVLL